MSDEQPQAGETQSHLIRVTTATIREDDPERDVYTPSLPADDELVEYLQSQTGDEGKPWWIDEIVSVGSGRVQGVRVTVEALSSQLSSSIVLTPEELARQGAASMDVTERVLNHVLIACRNFREKECAK